MNSWLLLEQVTDYKHQKTRFSKWKANEISQQQKKVSDIIAANSYFWKSLTEVDIVVLYGLSLSDIDMPYLKEVANHLNSNAEWYFSIFFINHIERGKSVGVIKHTIGEFGLCMVDCHTFQIKQYDSV